MSLRQSLLRLRLRPAASIVSAHSRTYATKTSNPNSSEQLGEGVVGRGDPNARPVILDNATPADPKDPEVRKHNEEFAKRPDRASNMIDEKNEPPVDKDFWKGQGGVDRTP